MRLGRRLASYPVLMAVAVAALMCAGCAASQNDGAAAHSKPIGMQAAGSEPATKPAGGSWVLVGENWVFITGNGPEICVDTVCAGADGSSIFIYKFVTPAGENITRCVLIETQGKKPGQVSKTISGGPPIVKGFLEKKASYIDVHVDLDQVDDAKEFDFKQDELDLPNQPATVPDANLWIHLRKIQKAMKDHGKKMPKPDVGP